MKITVNNDVELFKKEIEYLWDSNNLQIDMRKDLERLADKFAELEDKAEPKKVERVVADDQEASGYAETCPVCHAFVFDSYCAKCGQKLEWGK